jgi:23S rRNA (cytosine1962-C5)-methyltransferase
MNSMQHGYELLDFGEGRKLEQFGQVVLDRPSPAATGVAKVQPELWKQTTARFHGARTGEGTWVPEPKHWVPTDWCFAHKGACGFQLRLAALPSGQVGVFPEQRENWDWLARQVEGAQSGQRGCDQPVVRVLNLFAYTGGSTLACAAAGAEVTHVDAARTMVQRARQNAQQSNLVDRPIRWLVEDVVKFCQRELKRGKQYNAVILDPPSYGHGPKGEPWKIGEHLLPLLKLCGELTADRRAFVLVTCHSPGIGPAELAAYVAEGVFGQCGPSPQAGELLLTSADGRRLRSGVYARWPNHDDS